MLSSNNQKNYGPNVQNFHSLFFFSSTVLQIKPKILVNQPETEQFTSIKSTEQDRAQSY